MNRIPQENNLGFEIMCRSLEQNCPDTRSVFSVRRLSQPRGYGPRLGQALQNNTHVMSLFLNLATIVRESDGEIHHGNTGGMIGETPASCDPFLDFIQYSSTLSIVNLCDDDSDFMKQHRRDPLIPTPLLDELLQRMALSKSIREVVLGPCMRIPLEALTTCLKCTHSIQKLELRLENILAGEDLELLGQTFQGNASLESLTFYGISSGATLSAVLQQLQNHPSLRVLRLYREFSTNTGSLGRNRLPDSVLAFIRATKRLHEFEVLSFDFDENSMTSFVQALQYNNTSINHLTLSFCEMDADATNIFVEFVQRLGTNANSCAVRSVKLNNTLSTIDPTPSGSRSAGAVAAKMLVGSRVASIELLEESYAGIKFVDGFCPVIEKHADQVYVQSLQFGNMDDATWAALGACLPRLVYLRDLILPPFRVDKWNSKDNGVSFMHALRQNGSIEQVQLRARSRSSWFPCMEARFSKQEEHFVRAYCLRNQNLKAMLSQMQTTPIKERTSVGFRSSSRLWVKSSGLMLFPTLLYCAKQTPRMSAHFILLGLLSSVDHVGPAGDLVRPTGKRRLVRVPPHKPKKKARSCVV